VKFLSLFFASAFAVTLVACGPTAPSGDDSVTDQADDTDVEQVSGPLPDQVAEPVAGQVTEAATQVSEINDSGNLAEMAFEYLRTADEGYLEHIWITPELMKRMEKITGQDVPSENLEKHHTGIVESAKLVRKKAEELGIDWAKAKLVKAEREASGETMEYAPPSREDDTVSDRIDSFEVYLTIESGEATIKIRLDDCLGVDGKHVIGDCFLAPNMEGW